MRTRNEDERKKQKQQANSSGVTTRSKSRQIEEARQSSFTEPAASADIITNNTLHSREPNSNVMHDEETALTEEELRTERVKEGNDTRNIIFLLFLYFLQGIPLGISSAASFIVADKKSSYSDIALFSIANWPFSLKLLWAPFVDSVYWRKFGRRKSWLAPLQYLIGMNMLLLSPYIDEWVSEPTISHDHVVLLTVAFLFLYFLAATQDIVVDGWAITLLSRRRVSWASTANVIGQTAGSCVANLLLLSLSSASFCNTWLRSAEQSSDQGMLSFGDFLYIWGFVFLVATTLVLLKRERSDEHATDHGDHDNLGIRKTYWTLFQIGRLPTVFQYVRLLIVTKIAFSTIDSVTFVKLIEAGFPKETLAFFRVLLLPVDLLFPLVITRMRNYAQRPLSTWANLILGRILIGSMFAVLLFYTPSFRVPSAGSNATGNEFAFSYTATLFSLDVAYSCVTTTMFLAVMAFHARVSHPRIGGTYMTFLNTVSNISGTIPGFFTIWILDYITFSSCRLPVDSSAKLQDQATLRLNVSNADGSFEMVEVSRDFDCHTARGKQLCSAAHGVCDTEIDGYYLEVIFSILFGCIIALWCSRVAKRLDDSSLNSWMPAQLRSVESRQRLLEEEKKA